MTQAQAFAVLIGVVVLLFAGLYWLMGIEPKSGGDAELDEERHSRDTHSSSGDGPDVGPA